MSRGTFSQLVGVLTAGASPARDPEARARAIKAARARPPLPARAREQTGRLTARQRQVIAKRYDDHMAERRASGLLRARRGFVANLAHEFRLSVEGVKWLTSRRPKNVVFFGQEAP